MAQQARSDEQSTSTDGTGTSTGTNARDPHAANKRVEQLRGGLEKAVVGREEVIKTQALKLAEKLDAKTGGRHHNKIHVALRVVEFVVDNVGRRGGGEQATDANAKTAGGFGTRGADRGATNDDGPEDLGEFRNLNDDRAAG